MDSCEGVERETFDGSRGPTRVTPGLGNCPPNLIQRLTTSRRSLPLMPESESIKVVKLGPGEVADKAVLDALAAEGWELTSSIDDASGTELTFHRPAASD